MSSQSKPKVLVIVGPTASGKTSLAVELAKRFRGAIVSADSRQIYRSMDIGTAKPQVLRKSSMPGKSSILTPVFSQEIAHYLIDIKDPGEDYALAEFKKDAAGAINFILSENKLPIIAGGTGLYVNALVDNWEIPEVKPDPVLRQKIEGKINSEGLGKVFEELAALDPEAAYIVDPNNPRRVVRALEIAILTKKPFSAQRKKGNSPYDSLKIGLNPPRDILKEKIFSRADQMMACGLIDEVRTLAEKYGENCPAFDAIGYREIIDALRGKIAFVEAVSLIKNKTWNYARRQLTWFHKDKEIKWLAAPNLAFPLVSSFLNG